MVMAQGCAFGDRRRTTPDFAEKWCELVKNQWVIFFSVICLLKPVLVGG
jgi:hypothetical protein